MKNINLLRAVHKRRPQLGRREGLYSADILRTRGEGFCRWRFFRCGRPSFLAQKSLDFSKFMLCLHGQGEKGVEPGQTFCVQGEGSIFRDFVRTSFMEGPLLFQCHSTSTIKRIISTDFMCRHLYCVLYQLL